jgi:hypothetical protein
MKKLYILTAAIIMTACVKKEGTTVATEKSRG